MTIVCRKEPLGVRLARTADAVRAAQALRHQCFFGCAGLDAEEIDARCQHWLIGGASGLVGTFRTQVFASGAELGRSYAGARYDLSPLAGQPGPMIELGRFCVAPGEADADVMRLAWAALTRLVDETGATMLFGCSSFEGADPACHAAALTWLANGYVGPVETRPGRGAGDAIALRAGPIAARDALSGVPGLLRSYLGMGGWVSDHAVIDPVLDTLHVFTALPVAAIPPRRAAALRALAAQAGLEEAGAKA